MLPLLFQISMIAWAILAKMVQRVLTDSTPIFASVRWDFKDYTARVSLCEQSYYSHYNLF